MMEENEQKGLKVKEKTRQVSSMIHSARPTATPVFSIEIVLFC